MKQHKSLTPLASDLYDALAAQYTDLRLYISDLGMYHAGEFDRLNATITKPAHIPYFGREFSAALSALEMGWANRVEYHRDRIAAAVKRAGGTLKEVARVERVIGNIPQPTPRKNGEGGYLPRTGKE